jgi:PIN domain nuclease of toxin-antitoxin system
VIVLDTHAWLWWVDRPQRLSENARDAIDTATVIGVSTISAWELTMLVVRRRISLDREVDLWVRQALADERIQTLAPSAQVAVAAGELDEKRFPGDPADRLIYATARSIGATLITRDEAIRAFDAVSTLW